MREHWLGIIGRIDIQVDGWLPHMRLHPRVLAFEFDRLRGRKRQRIHGRAQNVAAGVLVEFAAILDQLNQLKLLVQRTAERRRQYSAGAIRHNERGFALVGFVGFGNLFDGFIALPCALVVVFVRGGPVHQILRHSSQS